MEKCAESSWKFSMHVRVSMWCAYYEHGWMVRWLAGWRVGWLDGWIAGYLDSWIASHLDSRWLDDWMTGWLDDQRRYYKRHDTKFARVEVAFSKVETLKQCISFILLLDYVIQKLLRNADGQKSSFHVPTCKLTLEINSE